MIDRAAGGVELTDAVVAEMVAEAEEGYEASSLQARPTPKTVYEERVRNAREARRKVLAKWARKHPSGRPMFCTPSEVELSTGKNVAGWGTDGKIIYDSLEIAEWAARELELLGAWPMRAYRCERSQHGHAHLAGRVARNYDE